MKHLATAALVLFTLFACQANEAPLTDTDRAEIETAVRVVFQTMVDGMNEDDGEKILSAYSHDILYTFEGETLEGWDAFAEDVRVSYSEPSLEPWHHRVDEIRVKVLSKEFAILSAWGVSGPQYEFGYSVTDLFQLTPDGWLIINEHESDNSPPEEEG